MRLILCRIFLPFLFLVAADSANADLDEVKDLLKIKITELARCKDKARAEACLGDFSETLGELVDPATDYLSDPIALGLAVDLVREYARIRGPNLQEWGGVTTALVHALTDHGVTFGRDDRGQPQILMPQTAVVASAPSAEDLEPLPARAQAYAPILQPPLHTLALQQEPGTVRYYIQVLAIVTIAYSVLLGASKIV